MNRLPEIGERVRYTPRPGSCVFRGPLTGTVTEHYPGTRVEGDDDPDAWGDDDGPGADLPIHDVAIGEARWEERWSVRVEIDEVPDWWPYGSTRAFAPSVSEIEPLES